MSDQRISTHFSLAEMTVSAMAARKGLPNDPPAAAVLNLEQLCSKLLEPIRSIIGSPITVLSGYRSPLINELVGGSKTSAHLSGHAADINAYGYGSARELAKKLVQELKTRNIPFDQIILEFDQWVHVGRVGPGGAQRHQVLTAKKIAGRTRYFEGLV